MPGGVDLDLLRTILTDSWQQITAGLSSVIPRLLGALFILLIGWAIAAVVDFIASRFLRRLGLDRTVDRLELTAFLGRAGVRRRPSALIGRLLFWGVLAVAVLSAIHTLEIAALSTTVERAVQYLPRLAAAMAVTILGVLFSRVVRNVLSSAAAGARLANPDRLGALGQGAVVLIVFVLSLQQLGLEAQLLIAMTTTLVAVGGLTVGITFALGARRTVAHIIAAHYLRQLLPREHVLSIGERRGMLERVGPVATLFRDGEKTWSIPNAQLLEEIVVR